MKSVQSEVARFLHEQGVFNKTANIFQNLGRGAKNLAMAHRGKLGLVAGAGIVGGIHHMGKKEQAAQQEAEELNQLLEAYPELLYSTPSSFEDAPESESDQEDYYSPSVY